MVRWIRARLSYANVASTLALFLALGTGTAYAANEWTGENIVDQSLTAADLQIGTIGTLRVQDNSLQAVDLAPDSVTSSEIAIDAVNGSEIANNAIDTDEIADNSLIAADLGTNSVGAAEIVAGAVGTSEIANNSVTSFDLAGGAANGAISIGAGTIANGRCAELDTAIPGAITGDAVIFSINGAAPAGVLFYGVRVPSNGIVTLKVCNFTGGVMPAIVDLPVAVITITI